MSKGMRFIVGRGNVDHALAAMRSRMSLSDAIVHRVRDEVQDSLRDGECTEIMIHGDIKTNNIHFNISNIDISLSNALGKATDSHPASPAALRHKPEFKSAEPPALAEFLSRYSRASSRRMLCSAICRKNFPQQSTEAGATPEPNECTGPKPFARSVRWLLRL